MIQSKSIAIVLRDATARLAGISDSPRLDAEVLLRHVLGIDRTELFARLQDHLSAQDAQEFELLIVDRLARAPVAHLIGKREFMGVDFVVNRNVLIPRPETEQLVEWALQWLSTRPKASVVDVGTGSGAIILSIAKISSASWRGKAIGTDISKRALDVAEANRDRLGLADRVELFCTDLLCAVPGPIDLILANLPYLTSDQLEENPQLNAEPRLALDGGVQGVELIRRLLVDAPRVLDPNGAIALEVDPSNAHEAARIAGKSFPDADVRVVSDLSDRDRFIIVEHDNKKVGP